MISMLHIIANMHAHNIRLIGGEESVILSSLNSDFSLSPPQRNHQLTFNATDLILRILGDDLPLQDRVYNVACAFVNGENTSNLISQMNVTVQLQEGTVCYDPNSMNCDEYIAILNNGPGKCFHFTSQTLSVANDHDELNGSVYCVS